jgi:Mg2+/Co2+ transporter CorC
MSSPLFGTPEAVLGCLMSSDILEAFFRNNAKRKDKGSLLRVALFLPNEASFHRLQSAQPYHICK